VQTISNRHRSSRGSVQMKILRMSRRRHSLLSLDLPAESSCRTNEKNWGNRNTESSVPDEREMTFVILILLQSCRLWIWGCRWAIWDDTGVTHDSRKWKGTAARRR
jgi:hypothetical protein